MTGESARSSDTHVTLLDTSAWGASSSALAPLATLLETESRSFGPPLDLEPSSVPEEIRALEADLALLIADFVQGPLEAQRAQAHDHLAGLRRAFMRHHRRVVVQLRADDLAGLAPFVRTEVAELAQRFRDEVLERASRLRHDPLLLAPFVEASDRAVSQLPESVRAPYEPTSFVARPEDGLGRRLMRTWLRFRRWRSRGRLERTVPLRRLAQYHVANALLDLEGSVSLLLQADVQLDTRTRNLFDGIANAFERLIEESTDPEHARQLAGQVKDEAEEELSLVEQDITRHFVDAATRLDHAVGRGVTALKRDLLGAGTFELPARERPASARVEARDRAVAQLVERLNQARDTLSASFSLSGLRFEYRGFVHSVEDAVREPIAGLEADLKGRTFTQVERVTGALEPVREFLAEQTGDETDLTSFEAGLREALSPLERVVQEALRAARQLKEQLESERATTPVVDVMTRRAQSLTDRYRVPIAPLRRSEWRIAVSPGTIEVPFSEIVAAFIQTDIAPHLQSRAARAGEELSALFSTLEDLERLSEYNPETPAEEPDGKPAEGVRQALLTAARTHGEALQTLRSETEQRARALGEELRAIVSDRLHELGGSFAEDEVSRLRGPRLQRRLRATGGWGEVVSRQWQRVRRRLLPAWRRLAPVAPIRRLRPDEKLALKPTADIPAYYSRLFSPQAHWAGTTISQDFEALDQAAAALNAPPPALRSVAVVGSDSSVRGALVAALTRRAELSNIRRMPLLRPVSPTDIDALLREVGRQEVVLVSGLGFATSARPAGTEALERIVRAVLSDRGRNAWIFEVDELLWRHLSRRTSLPSAIMERVVASPMDPTSLERAIYARHHLSGMRIHFYEHDRHEEVGPEGETHARRRGSIRDRYFRELHRHSDGLLQVALQYWLASIRDVRQSRGVVELETPLWRPREALSRLPDDALRTAWVACRQGWIDPESLEAATGRAGLAAEAQLAHLAHGGLLERMGPKTYQVRRELRGALQSVLRTKGYM